MWSLFSENYRVTIPLVIKLSANSNLSTDVIEKRKRPMTAKGHRALVIIVEQILIAGVCAALWLLPNRGVLPWEDGAFCADRPMSPERQAKRP